MTRMESSLTIADRIAAVQHEIDAACQRANRSPDSVTLVAVSKKHPPEHILTAVQASLRHFGENRVEEALAKIPAVAELTDQPLHWHLIGHIQSRKARYAVGGGYHLLHSVDNLRLAERLSHLLVEQDLTLDILLEMNISGEESKFGWDVYNWQHETMLRQTVWDDVRQLLALPGLQVRGLMTMAPIVVEPEETRPVFAGLRELRDALANDFSTVEWAELSMGMTDDYPVAIEEGATLIRVGRAIFGPRP